MHAFSRQEPQDYRDAMYRIFYVVAKATYIRLLHGKIGFLGFFRP